MQRYKILIEYDGTDFVGWQKQENGMSIQQAIEEAIKSFSGKKVLVYGSGRTDAGVHALGQVAHFDLEKHVDAKEVQGAINYFLKPKPISILSCQVVEETFHARFSAKQRSYVYVMINRLAPLALERNRAWHIKEKLDVEAMDVAAQILVGTHDFSSFRSASCQAKSAIKTINSISVRAQEDRVYLSISAPSFLHNQVRIITGNLVRVGKKKISAEQLKSVLHYADRTKAAETAPSDGLYLSEVRY